MASGGTMTSQRPEKPLDPSRGEENYQLGIKGTAVPTPRVSEQNGNLAASADEASPQSTSRPSSSSTTGTNSEPIGSIQLPAEAFGVIETVISMNKALEHQIEALRIRLDVESKQNDNEKTKISQAKDKQIQKKESEINDLQESLVNREVRIANLKDESEDKDAEIQEKEEEINDLKQLVKQTEDYAERLQRKVGKLKGEKKTLESDTIYKQQNDEIRRLKFELCGLKDKLSQMEKELARARSIIEQQDKKIKILELAKGELSGKFREELEKASKAMRQEVERMREVMKQQYEEMKGLREQNNVISSDVRDIKDLLLNNVQTARSRESIDLNNFHTPHPPKSPHPGTRVPTSVSRNSVAQSQTRTTMSNLPLGMVGRATQSGLPPISKQDTGKWCPVGNSRSKQQTKSVRKK